jgi:hypothetical protein
MSLPNINEETGVPYGVISAHSVPHLYDDITTHGEDDSYEEYKKEKLEEIAVCIDEEDRDDAIDSLAAFIKDNSGIYGVEAKTKAHDFIDSLTPFNDRDEGFDSTAEAEELFDDLSLNEVDIDEPSYSYTTGEGEDEEVYHTSFLGGAPLIWVIKSPHVTRARPCSPCVPNAGDLDNLDEGGIECYDVNPEYRTSDE